MSGRREAGRPRRKPARSIGTAAPAAAPRPLAGVSFAEFVCAWNAAQGRATPDLHLRIARWLDACGLRGDKKLLLMVFRDAGKSTLVGMYCAWLLGRDPDLRVLVLSAEAGLATKMTRNIRRLIERYAPLRGLLPQRREEWASDGFTVRRDATLRDPSLLAKGIGANITGCRADVIICDDVEVPNTADTQPKRQELRERLGELGFILVPGGSQIFIGTPHSYYSIYADEPREELGESRPFLAGFARLNVPLLDERTHAVWPDRFPPAVVRGLQAESGPQRFRSQMILSPAHARKIRLDPDRLVRYAGNLDLSTANGEPILTIDGRRMVGASCWWDPAMGRPGGGDASVVAAVFTDDSGGYWLHGMRYLVTTESADPDGDAVAQLCRQVVDFLLAHEQPSICVETNGLGKFLPLLLRRELRQRGHAIAVTEQASTQRKDHRILTALDPLLAARALRAHASVWDTPFIREMREWLPGASGNDDGLDAVSGCILAQPVRMAVRQDPARARDWRGTTARFAARTGFEP